MNGGNRGVGEDQAGLAARMAAAKLLGAIVDKRTSADGLTDDQHGHPQYLALDARDRSLVRAILATALRYRVTVETMLAERLDRSLPANAKSLGHILHVAMAQILFLDVPDSAAVNLAVTHAGQDPRTKRFTGLVNAVLRAVTRRKEKRLPAVLVKTLDAPDWFIARLKEVYGAAKAEAILGAHRRPAPIDLTVKSDPGHWAGLLDGVVTPTGSVRIEKAEGAITSLPGFADGEWWVQDAAAALPARLFGDVTDMSVADLCAAPGGKTAQFATAGARVTAVEISKSRLRRLSDNLDRLHLDVTLVCADIAKFKPDQLFDAVLLDSPCSSTGTMRRHPDISWTKTPADIVKLAGVQLAMLRETVRLTRLGGLIVFSNCSLDPMEGEQVAARFLEDCGDVELSPITPDEISGIEDFVTADGYLRTTPADMDMGRPEISGMDGFFAARFRRIG